MKLIGLHNAGGYSEKLYEFIKDNEDIKYNVYLDGELRPAIGIGYDLFAHKNTWVKDFKEAGMIFIK